MKDYLLDLIQHTHGLGVIDLVKITGTKKSTEINAIAEDKSVVVSGTFNTAIPDFEGVFGMPNLSKLKTILSFNDEYDEKSTISITRVNKDGEDTPTNIHFETANNDFVNDYRLMAKVLVEDKVKNVTFKGATYDVEFEPTIAGILRLKKQAQANSEEPYFTTKTDKGDLKIYFGDPSTHSGNFVFHTGVSGTLSRPWKWPVKVFMSILDLPGDKIVRIADKGATDITVDSGIAKYRYLLPAQSK
jgi:hypothetical protein